MLASQFKRLVRQKKCTWIKDWIYLTPDCDKEETMCDEYFFDYKYCPYCGKEIKIVKINQDGFYA